MKQVIVSSVTVSTGAVVFSETMAVSIVLHPLALLVTVMTLFPEV